ncbi:hypothetical protein [Embleya sp. NPDC059237]|uniref:hypothetical protein n=1 Tax=Embleya sp. NPDC059237 TaxID=3346784 RepID=UPI0036A4D0CC
MAEDASFAWGTDNGDDVFARSTLTLALGIAVSTGFTSGCSSSGDLESVTKASASPAASRSSQVIGPVTKTDVCRALTFEQQTRLGVMRREPFESTGQVSCYYLTTLEGASNSGYVVSLFSDRAALVKNVDGTGVLPAHPEPLLLDGRAAVRQMSYGDQWQATLVVDLGDGRFLMSRHYTVKHAVPAEDLSTRVTEINAMVQTNLRSLGTPA